MGEARSGVVRGNRAVRGVLLAWTLAAAGVVGACGGGEAAPSMRVMTRNLYLGADLLPVIAAAEAGDLGELVLAAADAWGHVQATDFPTRAAAIADEVANALPDVLALQEVALWRGQYPADSIGPSPTPATTVLQDFLAILEAALAAHGLDYVVWEVVETTDAELPAYDPGLDDLVDLRFTDRDVVLVRRERLGAGVEVVATSSDTFDTGIELQSGIEITRAWIALDLVVRQRPVRVVATHLDDVHLVQAGQAFELLAGPLAVPGRCVLIGDLNSDALHGPGPDDTPTYDDLLAAGFVDAWTVTRPGQPGETWGHDALLVDPGSSLWERIDFVLMRGAVEAHATGRYGYDPSEMVGGLWPSDHAGVAAILSLP